MTILASWLADGALHASPVQVAAATMLWFAAIYHFGFSFPPLDRWFGGMGGRAAAAPPPA